jgi:hypothetical protein
VRIITALGILCAASPALALDTKVRVWSYTNVGFPQGDVLRLDQLGASATIELSDWAIEAGGGASPFGDGADWHVFARGGVALPFLDDRGFGGRGLVLQGDGLFGYRFVHLGSDADGIAAIEQSHCITAAAGIEATYWFSHDLGFNVRLLAGATLPLGQTHDNDWSRRALPHTDIFADAELTFGLAF